MLRDVTAGDEGVAATPERRGVASTNSPTASFRFKGTLLLAAWFATGFAHAAQKPDIVVILADDLGSYDVSWRGGEIKTPHLDQLAASGAKLEQFYVQPVCSPTRASLMTGRYPMRYGLQVGVIRPWAEYGLSLEERMLPQALHEAGYTTAIFGKWHLGSFDKAYWPKARGFDRFHGHLFGAIDYFTHIRDGKDDWYRDDEPLKEEGYSTHLIARAAVQQVQAQPRDKPLFLYVPFNAVHAPHQVPEKYKEPYKNLPEPRRTYAGMLAAMDEAIGKILAALDETGRRRNAFIFFSSDNGGPQPDRVTSNGPLRAGKGTLYEGGVRVVSCAAWEGRIKPGSTVAAPMHMVDLYPTLLTIAGASLQQKMPLDGMNVLACLTEGKPSPHEAILLNTTPNTGALRMGDWKLVISANQGNADGENGAEPKKKKKRAAAGARVELFNLADDPYEKTDLSAIQPEKLKALRSRYDALAGEAVTPRNQQE